MAISKELLDNNNNSLYKNISSDQIQITVDKLKLKLERFEKSCKRSTDWQSFLGIILTSVAALTTASFNETLGISGELWKALFVVALVFSIIMLAISGIKTIKTKISIDEFIDECKKNE